MLYLSRFSLQSELESVKEENDIIKVFSAVFLGFTTSCINVICLNHAASIARFIGISTIQI